MRIPRSIGARLTLWYAAMFAAALLVLGVAMWFTVRQSLYHAVDESLGDRVRGIHTFIDDHKTRLDVDEVKEEFRAHGELFQVLDDRGAVVHRADTLTGLALPPIREAGATPRFDNVVADGEPLRFLTQNVAVGGRSYTVQVAAPLAELQEGLRDALWLLVPLFALMLLIASAGGYFLSRRALEPVDRITQTARSISADNLSQRLAVPSTGDELERLSATLNEMIGRLEAAFKRISRFTADASHELRTPLAVMRTTAEVALRHSGEGGEHRAALGAVVGEIERTTQLVDNLLLIAKADAGSAQLARIPVDIAAAAEEAHAQMSILARTKGIALEVRLPAEPVVVIGDRDALRRLFSILLDNALKYTAAGGAAEVVVSRNGAHALGVVTDTGIGIPADDLPHVFDRFYRVDRARSRELGGAGLGLAIARWIVESHGGEIGVASELERGSRFEVRLPLG
ncbi:MAG TPA: ATP-binding protein [Gammaproteobacteria bacterium]